MRTTLVLRLVLATLVGATALASGAPEALAQRGGAAASAKEGEPILIIMGETKSLPTGGKVERYAQGDTGIIQITPTADLLVIRPLKPGRTSITLYKTDGSQVLYDVTVAQRNPEQVKNEVQERIASIPGSLRVRVVGPSVVVEGNVPSEADRKRLEQLVAPYGGQVDMAGVTSGVASKTLVRLDFFCVQYEKTSGYNDGIAWPGSIGADATGRSVFQPD